MKNDINHHISESIKRYLKQSDTENAILLNGKWGCGKTHFIEDFIRNNTSDDVRTLYISLFGLKSSRDIDNRILSSFYPALESKPAKLIGALLKAASATISLDLDGSGTDETKIKADSKEINLYNLLIADKKDFILILDDFERTDIKVPELLGYIYNAVLSCKIKTIVIANEEEIPDENKLAYSRFKEKVIGKTFEVRHDPKTVISSFLKPHKFLSKHRDAILETFALSDHKNLRTVKQTIDDFTILHDQLEPQYKTHQDYVNALIRTFFPLSNTLRSNANRHNIKELLQHNSDFRNRYLAKQNPIFNDTLWREIIIEHDYSNLNPETSKLSYFIKSPPKEKDTLEQLKQFKLLEEPEFYDLLKTLVSEVKNNSETPPALYIEKIKLLAIFSEEGLSSLPTTSLKNFIASYENHYRESHHWGNTKLEDSTVASTSPTLRAALTKLIKNNNSTYIKRSQEASTQATSEEAEKFYLATTSGDRTALLGILKKRSSSAYFSTLSAEALSNAILNCKHSALEDFHEIVHSRYVDYRLRPHPAHPYYAADAEFWHEFKKIIQHKRANLSKFKVYIIEQFLNNSVDSFIYLLTGKKSDEPT